MQDATLYPDVRRYGASSNKSLLFKRMGGGGLPVAREIASAGHEPSLLHTGKPVAPRGKCTLRQIPCLRWPGDCLKKPWTHKGAHFCVAREKVSWPTNKSLEVVRVRSFKLPLSRPQVSRTHTIKSPSIGTTVGRQTPMHNHGKTLNNWTYRTDAQRVCVCVFRDGRVSPKAA